MSTDNPLEVRQDVVHVLVSLDVVLNRLTAAGVLADDTPLAEAAQAVVRAALDSWSAIHVTSYATVRADQPPAEQAGSHWAALQGIMRGAPMQPRADYDDSDAAWATSRAHGRGPRQ